MKNIRIAKVIAKIGRISAMRASGTASGYGSYQPKEPASLKSFSKQKK